MRIQHTDTRQGYDLWASSYDATANPVVHVDQRVTPSILNPRARERILDAGCGTGRYLGLLAAAGAQAVGFDFSAGMLRQAHQKLPDVPLVLADLQRSWPFRDSSFDAVLCALVGEHLTDLRFVLDEVRRVITPAGRVVFSVYHPAMAAAGKEANFQGSGVEHRLGAVRYRLEDYVGAFERAGFLDVSMREYRGDRRLVHEVPDGFRYFDFPVLLVIEARVIQRKERKACQKVNT